MTDAEYFKNVIELQKERYHPATNTGCTNVMTSRLERAIKDLERFAAIDEVFARHGMNKESWVTAVRSDNAALCCIEHLAAQDLLPKAEVAADG